MSASAKTLPCGVSTEWSVVLPRRRQRRNRPKTCDSEGTNQPWAPTDLQFDKDGESKLMHKVMKYVGKMQMVIYGIGSIESYEPPRLQLSLALLTKRKFDWIGEIEVFDPLLSGTETSVLEALGCSVLLRTAEEKLLSRHCSSCPIARQCCTTSKRQTGNQID